MNNARNRDGPSDFFCLRLNSKWCPLKSRCKVPKTCQAILAPKAEIPQPPLLHTIAAAAATAAATMNNLTTFMTSKISSRRLAPHKNLKGEAHGSFPFIGTRG